MSWSGTVTCSYCYGRGHNQRGCPKRKEYIIRNPDSWAAEEAALAKQKKRKCGWCNESGHNARTCKHKTESKDLLHNKFQPLLKTQVEQILTTVGLGRGAMVKSTNYRGELRHGVVLGAKVQVNYVRGGGHEDDGKNIYDAEPSLVVAWHDGTKDTCWVPREAFTQIVHTNKLTEIYGSLSLHEVLRSYGHSRVELVGTSYETVPVQIDCHFSAGQTIDPLVVWINKLTKSVKKCEDYKKTAKNA